MLVIPIISVLFINISFAANSGKISSETVRLRAEPKTDAKVLDLVSVGSDVEILEEQGEWYKVKYKDLTGYIRSDLLTVNKEEQATEATQETIQEDNKTEEATENQEEPKTEEQAQTATEEVKEDITISQSYKLVSDVKFKIIPLINGMDVVDVNKDTSVKVLEKINEWIKVQTTINGVETEGWIRKDRVDYSNTLTVEVEEEKAEEKDEETKTEEQANTTKTMYVNTQTVNLREAADKNSKVLKQLEINTQVTVISSANGWASVDVNGVKGYISESLLSDTKQETSRAGSVERNNTASANNAIQPADSSGSGDAVVAYAKQFLGSKYVSGGNGPNAFDCSGFTKYVYSNFNVNLNRTAAAQYSNGTAVSELQAGDLVMFGPSGISHVGIYIGGGSFIHAANPSRGVTIDTLTSGYYKTNYVGARRVK